MACTRKKRPREFTEEATIEDQSPGFAAFAISIGQPGFFQYFNLTSTGPGSDYTNNILGAVNALFFLGAYIGALTGGPLADNIGRRRSIITASIISIVGGALTAGSVHVAMLIIVRIVQGSGLARLHGFFLVCGYKISAWVGFGCFFSDNIIFGWRGPLAFTYRAPEGWIILSRIHGDPNDPDEVAAHEEFYQMKKQIEYEAKNAAGYISILRTPSYRKRVFYLALSRLTGYMPLLIYCVCTLIGALGNLFSLLTIDKTGRRFALLTGFIGCIICVVIEAAMIGRFIAGSDDSSIAGQKVVIVAVMMFVFF
ncbi:MFS general substrate transporter [Clathrospora elynae]|uniref:MFS general substrate transporter n=1 Tax=Clathrospora elynae TaxID=706981 RepID=A0A6A5SUF7_9PLEO|nr:MFS general substrate transporter [Clathrospora elynae]